MKKNRHENLKSAVSSYLKRRNYTTAEVTFRRSEFSRGISLQELVQDEELKSALAQENVICLNSMGPDLSTLDNQLSRFKTWLSGLPQQANKELSQLVPVVLSQMYLEAIAIGASRIGALKFLKRHYAPAVQSDELLDEIIGAGTCSEILTRPSIVRFRAGRTLVTASQSSLVLLQSFLATNNLALLLQVIGQWVQFVGPGYGNTEEVEEAGTKDTRIPEPMETIVEQGSSSTLDQTDDAEVEALEAAIKATHEGPLVPTPLRIFCVMNCEGNHVSCGALGNKANLLSTGSECGAVEVWSLTQDCLASGLSSQKLFGHTGPVTSVDWISSKAVLSGSVDHNIKLWPSESFTCAATYKGHMGTVNSLSVSPLNTYFASGSSDLSMKLWTPEFAFPQRTFAAHTQPVLCSSFHPNGLYLASGSRDSTVRLWATTEGRLVRLFSGHRAGIMCVAFSPDGKSLASAGVEPVIKIWDLAQGSCRLELTASPYGTTQLVWSKDCSNLAASSPDGTISVWDLTKDGRTCMASYATGTLAVLALHFTGHNLTCVGTAP